MKISITLGILAVLCLACGSANQSRSASTPLPAVPPSTLAASRDLGKALEGFPPCIWSGKTERFRNVSYFRLMLGDGLLSVAPEALALRAKAAAKRGENYKALYFARLLTSVASDNAAAWANRAALASAIGLETESRVASAIAMREVPPSREVPLLLLPGTGISARPTTLADWGAAMNLLADSVSAREGPQRLVAIRDDVSGIEVQAPEDTTPFAYARPALLSDVAPNLFVLRQSRPMSEAGPSGLMIGLAALAGATSAMAGSQGNAAIQSSAAAASGGSMAAAFAIDSKYKGGSYTVRTYKADGTPLDAEAHPRSSGRFNAVGMPVPILWASGQSLGATVAARLGDARGHLYHLSIADPSGKSRRVKGVELLLPRLHRICAAEMCSAPVSAMELMLEAGDVEAFQVGAQPGLVGQIPDLQAFRNAYVQNDKELTIPGLDYLVGVSKSGECFKAVIGPNAWVMAP